MMQEGDAVHVGKNVNVKNMKRSPLKKMGKKGGGRRRNAGIK